MKFMDRAILIGVTVVLGLTILYPTGRLLLEAFGNWRGDVLLTSRGFTPVWNTIVIGIGSVFFSAIIGTTLAFLLTRYDFPGRNVLAAAAFLPFTLPPLVGTLSFLYLLGLDGFVGRTAEHLFGLEGMNLQGPWGILAVHAYSFYVFFYAMVAAALVGMDPSLPEAARTLGASRWRVFTRVTLPMLRPALVGAGLLTFMSSGASFSAPYYFGGDYEVLSTEIFLRTQQGPEGRIIALTLTTVLALVALCGVIVFRSGKRVGGQASKGARVAVRSTSGRVAAGTLAWGTVFLLVIPHLTILLLSFADHRSWQTELFPTEWTFAHYAYVFSDQNMLQPILNSLWMSAVATGGIIVVALPASYIIGRKRVGAGWLNVLVMIPWALPGTVIAINLIVAFNDPWFPIYGTVWLLPLAYFVRNVPLFARLATASIETFDAGLIEAGRTLGASPAYCFVHIILPILAPAVAAGAAMVFAISLGEYVASILLYVTSNTPISIKIDQQWRGAGLGAAFAYSVFLMLLVAVTFVIARRFASRPV